jgi:hypothetical protein
VSPLVLPTDVYPQESLYYLGGLTLESLKENRSKMGFVDLFTELNKKTEVSIGLFVLILDWLFLIEAAAAEDDGTVGLCF